MPRHKELFKGGLLPTKIIGDRFELYRKFLGLKGYRFAKHLGISPGSYSDLKNNRSFPSYNTICNIIILGECDLEWLLMGKK